MDTALAVETNNHGEDPWVLLRALTMFRLLSCLFFVASPFLTVTQQFVASANPQSLFAIACLYALAGVSMALLFLRRQPDLGTQVAIQIYADIIFITLLMHQLGGIESGVGILLCASLSATALFRQAHVSYLFAAVATIAVLGQSLFQNINNLSGSPDYPQAAALCIALFVVSVLSAHFNKHRVASTAVIVNQQKRLAGLQTLSEEILRQFDHGLLAITTDGFIVHSNPAALRLLDYEVDSNGHSVFEVAPTLSDFLATSKTSGSISHENTELYVTVKRMKGDVQLLTLVSQTQRDTEAHQLKLASLGQWTASVAHEIRNPLSAITQAAQLLTENVEDETLQHRLATIVHRNSDRIDMIVTDILNLAKPSNNCTELGLNTWLTELTGELRSVHQLTKDQLTVTGDVNIRHTFDEKKLHHVIENLCKNSLTHGGKSLIRIQIEVLTKNGFPIIRISDNGVGIPPELHSRLFDPFYTNASGGTGLGLFIAREICEQQHISLKLCSSSVGTVFELRFRAQAQEILQAA